MRKMTESQRIAEKQELMKILITMKNWSIPLSQAEMESNGQRIYRSATYQTENQNVLHA